MHATTAADEIAIELLYTRGAYSHEADALDAETDLFELVRDLRCFGIETLERWGLSEADLLFAAYVSLGETTIPADEFDSTDALLEHVYRTCQGPAIANGLPYNGASHRSMSKGDVIVVDGTPYMVAGFGFEALDVDLRGDA